jgi:dienelactone hydrolase
MKRTFALSMAMAMLAWGAYADVRVVRDFIQVPGVGRVRTVTTIPPSARPLPALLLAGWLSCDPVESTGSSEGVQIFLNGIAEKSNAIFMRVEKPGLGGGDGDCSKTDFDTELAAYRLGWTTLAAMPGVDRTRMYVLGISNGGGIAPLVPSKPAAAGFIAIGGWSRTWLEHMLAFERRRYTLSGMAPGDVTVRMKLAERFYDEYLNRKRAPAAILRDEPDLKPAWDEPPDSQYGRPLAFYQQLQSLNLAQEWSGVRVPVLAICGGQDWIMDPPDHQLIADLVNRNGKLATFVELPKMDHFFRVHDSMAASFRDATHGRFESQSLEVVLRWLRSQTASHSSP